MLADGASSDAQWVRVAYEYETDYGLVETAWIHRDALADDPAVDTVPFIGPMDYTPLQAFYFETTGEPTECIEVPPAHLIIQSPQDVIMVMNVNDAQMRINGTVLLQAFPMRKLMRLTVLSGVAQIDNELVPAGYTAITCLDGPFSLGADGVQNDYVASERCEWQLAGQIDESSLAQFGLNAMPDGLFNYPIYIPELACDADGCEYRDTNPDYRERLQHLCDLNELSGSICALLEE